MADYAYDIDLVQIVHATGLTWPEKRSQLVAKIESSLWFFAVLAAAGDSYPFNADSDDPEDPELCCAAEMLEQLTAAPGEDEFFGVLEHFSSLFAYDRVQVRHGRHLSLA